MKLSNNRFGIAILLAIMLIGMSIWAFADDDSGTFFAVLGGGQVVPPVPPAFGGSATGTALMTFNESTNLLCYAITYTGFATAEIAAHFHTPAGMGVNAPAVITISPTILGFGPPPAGPSPLGSPKTGCVGPLSDQQADDLEDGLFYIQLHSTAFPPGEIRGQVLPVGED